MSYPSGLRQSVIKGEKGRFCREIRGLGGRGRDGRGGTEGEHEAQAGERVSYTLDMVYPICPSSALVCYIYIIYIYICFIQSTIIHAVGSLTTYNIFGLPKSFNNPPSWHAALPKPERNSFPLI